MNEDVARILVQQKAKERFEAKCSELSRMKEAALRKAKTPAAREKLRRDFDEDLTYLRKLASEKFLADYTGTPAPHIWTYVLMCNALLKEACDRLEYPVVQLRGIEAPGLDRTCGWVVGTSAEIKFKFRYSATSFFIF